MGETCYSCREMIDVERLNPFTADPVNALHFAILV